MGQLPMKRVVVPELLDAVPASDPGAIASRRDLRMLNGIMGNFRWLARKLAETVRDDDLIVEIGAGDGGLARRICAWMPHIAARYHALDLAPVPARWPEAATWHQADLMSESGRTLLRRATLVVANLVLHHFDDTALREIGLMLSHCRVILACEPCRREWHVWQGRLLFPVLHRITRHDMIVSIRAGFRGVELAELLGLDTARWHCRATETLLGSYRVVAVNKS